MKKIFLTIFVLALWFNVFSQQADSKLYDIYTIDQIEHYRKINPKSIDYLNFYVNNVAMVATIPDKPFNHQQLFKIDQKTGENISDEITEADLIDFNPYLYNCKSKNEKYSYYIAGDTGKMIIMRSTQEMARRYRQYQKNNK